MDGYQSTACWKSYQTVWTYFSLRAELCLWYEDEGFSATCRMMLSLSLSREIFCVENIQRSSCGFWKWYRPMWYFCTLSLTLWTGSWSVSCCGNPVHVVEHWSKSAVVTHIILRIYSKHFLLYHFPLWSCGFIVLDATHVSESAAFNDPLVCRSFCHALCWWFLFQAGVPWSILMRNLTGEDKAANMEDKCPHAFKSNLVFSLVKASWEWL